jgi:hypothetical protein
MGMWSEPALRLNELASLLRRRGLIAIVSQPRCPGATAETTAAAASQIVEGLEAAGLVAIRVIGTAPSAAEPVFGQPGPVSLGGTEMTPGW